MRVRELISVRTPVVVRLVRAQQAEPLRIKSFKAAWVISAAPPANLHSGALTKAPPVLRTVAYLPSCEIPMGL